MAGFLKRLFNSSRAPERNPSPERPLNAALYCRRRVLVSLDDIKKLAPEARVTLMTKGRNVEWKTVGVAWPGVMVTMNRMDDEQRAGHLAGFCGYITQMIGDEHDFFTWDMLEKINRTRNVIGTKIEATSGVIDNVLTFLQQLASQERALVFVGNGIAGPDFHLLLAPGEPYDAEASLPEFESALARKARSEARLRQLMIPILPGLPTSITDEEACLPAPAIVARRAQALTAVALHGAGCAQDELHALITALQIKDAFTPKEQAFIARANPDNTDMMYFSWRFESLLVLLWALGLVETLDLPQEQAAIDELIDLVQNHLKPDTLANQRLRPINEILDTADFIYRCHWAVRQARISDGPLPANLDPDITEEWHYALKWLVEYEGKDWDDVDPST